MDEDAKCIIEVLIGAALIFLPSRLLLDSGRVSKLHRSAERKCCALLCWSKSVYVVVRRPRVQLTWYANLDGTESEPSRCDELLCSDRSEIHGLRCRPSTIGYECWHGACHLVTTVGGPQDTAIVCVSNLRDKASPVPQTIAKT